VLLNAPWTGARTNHYTGAQDRLLGDAAYDPFNEDRRSR